MFDDIVRRATPYNEAQTIWNINRERVDVPLFKRYRELDREIEKIREYNIPNEFGKRPLTTEEYWAERSYMLGTGRNTDEGMDIYGRGRYRDIDYTRTIPHHKILEMCDMF